MKHPTRVEDYLGHMAEAIQRAISYVQALPDRRAFEQNPQVQDAPDIPTGPRSGGNH